MSKPDDGFTLDTRRLKMPRRNRRDPEPVPMDGWTWSASPLEHFILATVECSRLLDGERSECQDARWAEHLRACENCYQQELFARIRAFAAEHFGTRGAVA